MKLWKRISLVAVAGAWGAMTVGAALAADDARGGVTAAAAGAGAANPAGGAGAGAAAPAGSAGSVLARRGVQPAVYWAYQPLRKPAVPPVTDADWARTPVDGFILAKLEEQGLAPSPEADRATFARRIYLDVLGLIPTPEQVREFVEDDSPDAYERLVDGLLASPHYGERIGRKWLDLARYADTQGYQDDEARPGAWRYRDYVVSSFNQDKPFDRFVREQLAGDELWPGSQEALVATGFLRNYPDGPDHRDMLERRYNSITDMTDTVGSVLLGHSLECARCHDHKFDRISQQEYFQFQAFFANTLPSDNLPVTEKGAFELGYEQARAAWEQATLPIRNEMQAFIAPWREEIDDYHYTRFYQNVQESLRRPADEVNALDRWVRYRYHQYIVRNNPDYALDVSYFAAANGAFRDIVDREAVDPAVDPAVKAAHVERAAAFAELLRQFRSFDRLKPVQGATIIHGVFENGTDAVPQFVYMGGNPERPLQEVQPGFPAAITPALTRASVTPTAHSSGRRTALANWIASADNPLTARVFVNRVWEFLFGQGIVTTPSDIGRASQSRSHPQLLDYLAARFIEQGWSVKKLQREILLSATYRQSSAPRPDVVAADPQNRLLAVYPRRRLDAEQVRDSLLAAAGVINLQLGGPAVYPHIPPAVMKESTRRVAGFWPVSKDIRDHHRRSIYVFTRRSVPFPMLEVFDRASPQVAHARREVSTTPQQSLTLFNNEVVYGWSHALAARATSEARAPGEQARIERLFHILFARAPDAAEQALARDFLASQAQVIAATRAEAAQPELLQVGHRPGEGEGEGDGDAAALAPREQAFVDLAHALANSNEFIYRY